MSQENLDDFIRRAYARFNQAEREPPLVPQSSPSQTGDNRTQPESTWLTYAGSRLPMRDPVILSSLYP